MRCGSCKGGSWRGQANGVSGCLQQDRTSMCVIRSRCQNTQPRALSNASGMFEERTRVTAALGSVCSATNPVA